MIFDALYVVLVSLQLYNLALFSHNRVFLVFNAPQKDRSGFYFCSTAHYYEILIGQIILVVLFTFFIVFWFLFWFFYKKTGSCWLNLNGVFDLICAFGFAHHQVMNETNGGKINRFD